MARTLKLVYNIVNKIEEKLNFDIVIILQFKERRNL